jgi:hypothetical protein
MACLFTNLAAERSGATESDADELLDDDGTRLFAGFA